MSFSAIFGGARQGELLGLKWSDIDCDDISDEFVVIELDHVLWDFGVNGLVLLRSERGVLGRCTVYVILIKSDGSVMRMPKGFGKH